MFRKQHHGSTPTHVSTNPQFNSLSADHILHLQQTIGNSAVQRLLQSNTDTDIMRDSHGKGCRCNTCGSVQPVETQSSQQTADSGGYNIQRAADNTISLDEFQGAQQEVQSKAPEGHGKGCGCSSCSGGRVQRSPLQSISKTNKPQIQRDIVTEWRTRSKSFWTKGRSTELQAIDTAVQGYLDSNAHTSGGLWRMKLDLLPVILDAISIWKASKGTKTLNGNKVKRLAAVQELEVLIKSDLAAVRERKRLDDEKRARSQPIFDKWMTLSGGMDEYAKRNSFNNFEQNVDRFDPTQIAGRMKAINMNRNEDGSLNEEGISENDRLDTESLKDKNLGIGAVATLVADPSITKEQIKKLRDDNINPVTGETIYPELNNLLGDDTGEKDEEVTETKDLGGISFKVTYNKSDVNFGARLEMLKAAVVKIKSAGFTPPALDVYLPKMGRSLSISGECTISEGASKTERAVYVAPNFMHISSENMNNPLDTKKSDGSGEYKFSSTTFDPSGIGTIVHEFGHAMHRANNGGKFHELWGSGFKNAEMVDIAKSQVSEYGTVPREFVAEVFLGMVYGRTYSEDVMKMYRAFGGAPKS